MQRSGGTPTVIGPQSAPKASTSKDTAGGYSAEKPGEHDNTETISDIIAGLNTSPSVEENGNGNGRESTNEDGDSLEGNDKGNSPKRKYNTKKFSNKPSKVSKEVEMKNQFLQSISDSLTSMAKFVSEMEEQPQQPNKNAEPEDDDLGWAKLLVSKLKRMSQEIVDKFKVFVDNLAVKAINGEWP